MSVALAARPLSVVLEPDCDNEMKFTQQDNEISTFMLIIKMSNAQSDPTIAAELIMKAKFCRCADTCSDILQEASGFLIDWDGCCALDNKLLPGAARFLKLISKRVVIVSNNSSDTPLVFLDTLNRVGIELSRDQIILAGMVALERARELNLKSILVLGSSAMCAQARSMGLTLVKEKPDAVILLRDTKLSYVRLERAVNAIAGGARLIVSNPDLTHPGANGRIKPETGALYAALRACINIPDDHVEFIGKPEPLLFRRGLKALGLSASGAVMIGDNSKTDIAGAEKLGITGLLVQNHPDDFMNDLADLLEALH